MASPQKSTVESIEDKKPDSKPAKTPTGPPPASPKPKSAADSSLFSQVGQNAQQAGQAGMGQEGGSPQIMSMQGMALVTRGVQILNVANPDNPGLLAVLSDLMGRLQMIVPQLIGQGAQGGGQGLFPQQPGMGGPPQPGMPPGGGMGGGMPAPPMGGGPPMGPM